VFGVAEAVRLRLQSESPEEPVTLIPLGLFGGFVRPGGLGDPGTGGPVLELYDEPRHGIGGASAGDTVMVDEPKPEGDTNHGIPRSGSPHPLPHRHAPLSRRQLVMQVVVAAVILGSGVGIGSAAPSWP